MLQAIRRWGVFKNLKLGSIIYTTCIFLHLYNLHLLFGVSDAAAHSDDYTKSALCSYLELGNGQLYNAYLASAGHICCMCSKGTAWKGDCDSLHPSTTICKACHHNKSDPHDQYYMDFEPHKLERCHRKNPPTCRHPAVYKEGSIKEKSKCVCPEGMVWKSNRMDCVAERNPRITAPANTTAIFNNIAAATSPDVKVNSAETGTTPKLALVDRFPSLPITAKPAVLTAGNEQTSKPVRLRETVPEYPFTVSPPETKGAEQSGDARYAIIVPVCVFCLGVVALVLYCCCCKNPVKEKVLNNLSSMEDMEQGHQPNAVDGVMESNEQLSDLVTYRNTPPILRNPRQSDREQITVGVHEETPQPFVKANPYPVTSRNNRGDYGSSAADSTQREPLLGSREEPGGIVNPNGDLEQDEIEQTGVLQNVTAHSQGTLDPLVEDPIPTVPLRSRVSQSVVGQQFWPADSSVPRDSQRGADPLPLRPRNEHTVRCQQGNDDHSAPRRVQEQLDGAPPPNARLSREEVERNKEFAYAVGRELGKTLPPAEALPVFRNLMGTTKYENEMQDIVKKHATDTRELYYQLMVLAWQKLGHALTPAYMLQKARELEPPLGSLIDVILDQMNAHFPGWAGVER